MINSYQPNQNIDIKERDYGISDAPAWWIAQADTLGGTSRLDTVHRVADRIQSHGANGRARTGSDGANFELGDTSLISPGARSSNREISRRRQGRRREDDQRGNEGLLS